MLPGSYSATKSLGTRSTSTPSTGTPPTRRQQETKTTLSSSAKARPEGNTKPLQSRFISECQNITKISKKNNENEENSRETAKDPDFDEYHDIEGKNKDEENKTKFNKKAGTYASQFTDWSSQLTRLNAIGQHSSAELGRNSNEAALGVGQNTSSYETERMVSDVSEGNCDALNDEGYSAYNCV